MSDPITWNVGDILIDSHRFKRGCIILNTTKYTEDVIVRTFSSHGVETCTELIGRDRLTFRFQVVEGDAIPEWVPNEAKTNHRTTGSNDSNRQDGSS